MDQLIDYFVLLWCKDVENQLKCQEDTERGVILALVIASITISCIIICCIWCIVSTTSKVCLCTMRCLSCNFCFSCIRSAACCGSCSRGKFRYSKLTSSGVV
jgi:hypothetical protein